MSVYTFYNLIDYMLLVFGSLCSFILPAMDCLAPYVLLVSDAVINAVVMTPVAANELTGTCGESGR